MKNNKVEEVVYSINTGDIQDVANEILDRPLTKKELINVGNSVGNYIDWFQAIEHAIRETVPH